MRKNLLSILSIHGGIDLLLGIRNDMFASAFTFPIKNSPVSFLSPSQTRKQLKGLFVSNNNHNYYGHEKDLHFLKFSFDEKRVGGEPLEEVAHFYPFSSLSSAWFETRNDNVRHLHDSHDESFQSPSSFHDAIMTTSSSSLAMLSTTLFLIPTAAAEAATSRSPMIPISTGDFNPANFRPVCPASDGIYRFAQAATQNIVGPDNFVEYGPLIAGGLLRIRLELCVVESFFNEAVGPFIEREGLRWILPLHETVETFLAGTIFALASTFILVGSTKIVSVLFTYADLFVGAPCRWLGGFGFDRARGKPVTLDVGFGPFKTRVIGPGDPKEEKKEETLEELLDMKRVQVKDYPLVIITGTVKAFGETSKVARDILEAIDLFVGRYLTLLASGYIGIKFLHFKVFPDFPPF